MPKCYPDGVLIMTECYPDCPDVVIIMPKCYPNCVKMLS